MDILLRRTLSVTPLRNLPKERESLAIFDILQNLYLYVQKAVCATNFGPFGEIGANFSLQMQFSKIKKNNVIAENQCEKIKNRVQLILLSVLGYLP